MFPPWTIVMHLCPFCNKCTINFRWWWLWSLSRTSWKLLSEAKLVSNFLSKDRTVLRSLCHSSSHRHEAPVVRLLYLALYKSAFDWLVWYDLLAMLLQYDLYYLPRSSATVSVETLLNCTKNPIRKGLQVGERRWRSLKVIRIAAIQ